MSKKLIIAISALALAILAGAIAVVGVFAAQQQKVANTFTISYTANNVSCTGWADYTDEAGGGSTIGSLTINPEDNEQEFTMLSKDFTLTASNSYVLLFIAFMNTNTAGGKSMTVALTDTSATKTNVTTLYAVKKGASGYPYPPLLYTDMVGDGDNTGIGTTTVPATITLAPQAGCIYSILIEIADDTLDAEYISTAEAGLGFTLNAV